MQNNESLKQQCLNQLIGQAVPTVEEAQRQAPSHNPQRNNRRGQRWQGQLHESAKICHSHNPANLWGDAHSARSLDTESGQRKWGFEGIREFKWESWRLLCWNVIRRKRETKIYLCAELHESNKDDIYSILHLFQWADLSWDFHKGRQITIIQIQCCFWGMIEK